LTLLGGPGLTARLARAEGPPESANDSTSEAAPPDGAAMGGESTSSTPTDDELDPETRALKLLYDEAHVAFLAGRHLDAAAKFDEGYAKSNNIAFLFNSAVAWEQGGKLQQAAERYAEYLVKSPDAPDFESIKKRIEALRLVADGQTEAKVEALATKGVIEIDVKPAGAVVRLDDPSGPVWATAPVRSTLPPGKHVVYVSAEGYKTASREFPDNAGKFLVAVFELSEEYFLGQVEVRSPIAGADVYLKRIADPDGKPVAYDADPNVPVGKTPFSNQLPPGKWDIRVEKLGYKTYADVIDVEQGKIRTVELDPKLIDGAILKLRPQTSESIDAQVFLDEEQKTPLCTLPCQEEVLPGEHRVVVRKKKKKELEFTVNVRQADIVEVDITMEPATRRYPAIVTGVLMAGAIGTGAFFAVRARNIEDDLQRDIDKFEQITKDDSRVAKGRTSAIVADSLFGVSALLGALTLYYLLRQTGEPSVGEKEQKNLAGAGRPGRGTRVPMRDRVTLSPTLSPEGGGLFGQIRF